MPGTALEATFNVKISAGEERTDNIDITYVDSCSLDGSFATSGAVSCTQSHECDSDADCTAQRGSHCTDLTGTGAQKHCYGPIQTSINVTYGGCPSDITLSGDDHTYYNVDLRVCEDASGKKTCCTGSGSEVVTDCISPKTWLTDGSVPCGPHLHPDSGSDVSTPAIPTAP